MTFFRLVAVLALLASVSVAQQYNGGGGNYVDADYDYDSPQPAPRPAAPQRSYSRPAPPPPSRSSSAPTAPRPTPVAILKQINRHNEDGSYTYGYEGADGSFKIETKLSTGEVMGKYGYVDDQGKVRVVEYGANRYGFQPSGEGITVAPPTLVDESTRRTGEVPQYDDGQYYDTPAPRPRPQALRPAPQLPHPAPQPQPQHRLAPQPPRPAPQPQHRPAPQPQHHSASPPQQFASFDAYPEEPQYRPAPQSQPRVSNGPAPVPARAQIPGAAPVGGVVYSAQPQHAPAPPRPTQHQAPVYHAQPIAQPIAPPPPRPVSRPAPQTRQAGGLLDQLAKDYALPQGGHALHDISFGYYS